MQPEFSQVISGDRTWSMVQGDCLDLLRQLPDACADAVITDPPYGMAYQAKDERHKAIANDDHPFVWWLYDASRLLKPGGSLVCFCEWRRQEDFRRVIEIAGLQVRSQVIWDRRRHSMGNTANTFAPQHDVIWFATKGRFRFPSGRPKSVLPVQSVPAQRRAHPTEKPLDLMRQLVRAVTPVGGLVIDPCAGVGSTGEASLMERCRFVGCDLDAGYVTEARARLTRCNRPRYQAKPAPARWSSGLEVACA